MISTIFNLIRAFKNQRNTFLNPHEQVNVYIPQLDVIYISISKTGISSMRSLFLKKTGTQFQENDYKSIHRATHNVFEYITKQEIIAHSECFKFAFVRNPFDRLVSCYKNKLIKEDYAPIQKGYGSLFYGGMPFNEFAKNICKVPDYLSDRHFRSQTSYLYENNNLIVDFLGKYENISEDFKIIQEKYNLDDLPHYNRSQNTKDYKEFYSRDIIDLVYKRYKDDIHNFGYYQDYLDLKSFAEKKERF